MAIFLTVLSVCLCNSEDHCITVELTKLAFNHYKFFSRSFFTEISVTTTA